MEHGRRVPVPVVPLTRRVDENIDLRVDGERDGAQEADAPQGGNYPNGALEAAHRVQVQWVTNGQKALHGERDDRQHRYVGGAARHRWTRGLLKGHPG